MQAIQRELTALKGKYRQLQAAQDKAEQLRLIAEMRQLGDTIEAMHHQFPARSGIVVRQVRDVLQGCADLEARLNHVSLPHSSEQYEAVVELALHSFARKSLELKAETDATEAEVLEVVDGLRRVAGVIECIWEMTVEHQGKLELVEEEMGDALGNTKAANVELTGGVEAVRSTRRMKLKAAAYGVLAGLGYFLLGLPGMVAGFFASWTLF